MARRLPPIGRLQESAMLAARAVIAALAVMAMAPAFGAPMHKCDPVTEEGWSVMPDRQVLSTTDGAPYKADPAGTWYVDRTTTVLPFCNYYNAIGIYSLNSYSLEPMESEERVAICRPAIDGRSVAVPPYGGPCPPK
jgi:hypothetical protein